MADEKKPTACAPEGQDVELLELPPGAVPGGINFGDIFKYLPVIQMLIAAIAARSGTFVTKTPFGRVRVTVEPV